jgi:hypothetical protein
VINGAAEGDASESFTSVGFCSVGAATAVEATSSTTHKCALWAVIPATKINEIDYFVHTNFISVLQAHATNKSRKFQSKNLMGSNKMLTCVALRRLNIIGINKIVVFQIVQ